MINKIKREDYPNDFKNFIDEFVEDSYKEHRRGSNFFTKSIVEINEQWFPNVSRELDGFWETNQYISDDNHGAERDEITELNRVELKEKVVVTKFWQQVKN